MLANNLRSYFNGNKSATGRKRSLQAKEYIYPLKKLGLRNFIFKFML